VATQQHPWIIEDIAVGRQDQDRFDHQSVAVELADIARESTAPLAIGLLGRYGSGKSTVVRLLKNELQVNRGWAVLQVSAERHTGVARARALLYGLLEEAHDQKLIKEAAWQSQRGRLEGSQQGTHKAPEGNSANPKSGNWFTRHARAMGAGVLTVGAFALVIWVVGLLTVGIGHLAGTATGIRPVTWFAAGTGTPLGAFLLGTAVAGGLLGIAKDAVQNTLRGHDITVTHPRADTTDELERVFKYLIGSISRRLIIAIDDIDRLTADEVLEALATVRALLLVGAQHTYPPVFVISCDEDIVREAIVGERPRLAHRPVPTAATRSRTVAQERKASEEAAQEYLNKLFAVRRYLPDHQGGDLRVYAEQLLAQEPQNPLVDQLGGWPVTRAVIAALIHQQVRDPRHAIRLLNAFVTDFRLARRREQTPSQGTARIAPGEVTAYPLTLARLTVLRYDFRALFDAVGAEHELLAVLDDALLDPARPVAAAGIDPLLGPYLIREDVPEDEEQERVLLFKDDPGLSYLRATAAMVRQQRPHDLGPLLSLGSAPASRFLGSEIARQIRAELIGRDAAAFAARLQDPAGRVRVLEAATATIEGVRPGPDLDNAVSAATQALHSSRVPVPLETDPTTEQGSALRELADRLADHRGQMGVPLAAEDLAVLLDHASPAYHPAIVADLAVIPNRLTEQRSWARTVLDLLPTRKDPALAASVDEYFDTLATGSSTPQDLTHWIKRHHDTDSEVRSFWPPQAYRSLLAMSARHGDPQSPQQVAAIVRDSADEHAWQLPVILGLITCLTSADPASETTALDLLAAIPLPLPLWADLARDDQAATAQRGLVESIAELLDASTDASGATRCAGLLRTWLPHLTELTQTTGRDTGEDTAIAALTAAASKYIAVTDITVRLLEDLPAEQAASLASDLAKILSEHRDNEDPIGGKLRTGLLTYLRRAHGGSAPGEAEAAQECMATLTAELTSLTPQGAFARTTLPALVDTPQGHAARGQLATTVLSSVPQSPSPDSTEFLGCLHALFQDVPTRAAYLPAALARLMPWFNHGSVGVPLGFAAPYADQPAVDATWLNYLAQHWAALPLQTRDAALKAAERPELVNSPGQHSLGNALLQHIIDSGDQGVWAQAPRLWGALNDAGRTRLLASTGSHCPDLAPLAAALGPALLCDALDQADDDAFDELVDLIAAAPHAAAALNDYLTQQLDTLRPWEPDKVKVMVARTSGPELMWATVLERIAEDRSVLERCTGVLADLTSLSADTVPANLVDRLEPVLLASDDISATHLGTALRGLPSQAGKLSRRLGKHNKSPAEKNRNAAFRKALR
jgi:hypothetical protein